MKKESDNIELRSQEIQEALGKVPPWILRWGITLLAFILLIMLIGSAIFKYPDTIKSKIVLTTSTPVAEVIAKNPGKLQELYVTDNQKVKSGDYLAIIENSATTKDILKLKEYLSNKDSFNATRITAPAQLQLGTLQNSYASFYRMLSEYVQFMDIDYYSKKIELKIEQLKLNNEYYKSMHRQKELLNKQRIIANDQYERDSSLFTKSIISLEELENSYKQLIQHTLSFENMQSTLESQKIKLEQIKETLFDMEYQYIDTKNTLETQLKTQVSQILTDINSWEIAYALKAPIDGKITFTGFWVENQNVTLGDIVFNVIPTNQGKLIGRALLPTERSGKVKVGQKINVRFANFPDNEYGIVRGCVDNISLVPSPKGELNYYTVEIGFPDGLITTYKKELPLLSGMEGQAEIITEDIPLIMRFIFPIKKILTEGLK